MIYTVTFNPSLDYVVNVENLKLGQVNRTMSEEIYPGGKGINVSIVLRNLGFESTALGFTAGFVGREIEELLQGQGCHSDFINVNDGISRINVKIKSREESEINGQGPRITEENINELYSKLDKLEDGDFLVLAGSIPNTLPEDIYERISKRLEEKQVKIVVDATKDLLINVLKYKPFLIKPNNHELEEIFKVKLDTEEEILTYGRKLQGMGARNVLISMAKDGAILISETGEVYSSKPPAGKLINSVGAGDSMVAGFTAGYIESQNYEKAFKMGVATGSATAFSKWLTTKEEVLKLIEKL